MAAYFVPPPSRPAPQPQVTVRTATETFDATEELERSIFIFPTPPSLPSSPGGSDVSSMPSDLDSFTVGSSTRSRLDSEVSVFTTTTASDFTLGDTSLLTAGSRGSTDEVEVWDWTMASGDDPTDEEEYWEYEAEIERISRQTLARRPTRLPLASRNGLYSSDTQPIRRDLLGPRYHAYLRSRTHSSASAASLQSHTAACDAPHPRMRIPLLSFFASLLALDLDDPVLRLLTQPSSDSILFPGQEGMLGSRELTQDPHDPDSTLDVDRGSEAHGMLRLLTERSPTRLVKDGLAVVYNAPMAVPNPFSIPTLESLASLCRFVGDVCLHGQKAWRELRSSSDAEPSEPM